MAEELIVSTSPIKADRYKALLPQIKSLVGGEEDQIANLSNIAAALKQAMNFFWVGFYFVRGQELVLGPFQGPVACTRIGYGKGVCGACWEQQEVIIVPDVNAFPGHIACSSSSQSEIVLPAFKDRKVALVLDVDSELLNNFDEIDRLYLSKVVEIVQTII